MNNYQRIEKAIHYMKEHFREQPDLNEVASQVHMSPFHFQRIFKEWAAVSPKKFLQFISVEYAKKLLQKHSTLSDVSFETGLSGTGRLHDLFVGIEGMTPGEYKNGGEALSINYSFAETIFGNIIIASTPKGVCHLAFVNDDVTGKQQLQSLYPKARIINKTDLLQQQALRFFNNDWNDLEKVKLHLKGTPFQLKVWNSLLSIPFGSVSTYGNVAMKIDQPTASRAVGTAIGSNPVAYLIPCHRVIRSSGVFGNYMWGDDRKTALLGWEAAQLQPEEFSGNL